MRSRSEQASRWVRGFDALRESAASAFAVSPAGREACVRAMLTGHTKDRASYWLQLLVAGWGLGMRHWDVMRGAALLFTANFCAIVLLTTLMFTVLGFNRVAVHELEEQAAEPARAGYRVAVWLRRLLGSRYGLLLRLVMPLVFVGAVFVPLRRALEEVVWQVRVRRDVQALIDRLAPPSESVHSIVSVASRNATVRLVILGDAARASRIEGALCSGHRQGDRGATQD